MLVESHSVYKTGEAFNKCTSFSLEKRYKSQNDFELDLKDYSITLTNSTSYYKNYVRDLNWFQIDAIDAYTTDINAFANYTMHSILLRVFNDKSYILADLENFFSDQLYSFMKMKGTVEKDSIKILAKYCLTLRNELTYFYNVLSKFSNVQGLYPIYLNSPLNPENMYKFMLPLITFNNPKLIELHLLMPYYSKVHNWFTIASIFKIYKYFANLDIIINKVHYSWYNMDNYFTTPIRQSIPLTENIAKMVAVYGDIMPLALPNIFTNDLYKYKLIPLSRITSNIKI